MDEHLTKPITIRLPSRTVVLLEQLADAWGLELASTARVLLAAALAGADAAQKSQDERITNGT